MSPCKTVLTLRIYLNAAWLRNKAYFASVHVLKLKRVACFNTLMIIIKAPVRLRFISSFLRTSVSVSCRRSFKYSRRQEQFRDLLQSRDYLEHWEPDGPICRRRKKQIERSAQHRVVNSVVLCAWFAGLREERRCLQEIYSEPGTKSLIILLFKNYLFLFCCMILETLGLLLFVWILVDSQGILEILNNSLTHPSCHGNSSLVIVVGVVSEPFLTLKLALTQDHSGQNTGALVRQTSSSLRLELATFG